MTSYQNPIPLLDTVEYIRDSTLPPIFQEKHYEKDFQLAKDFILQYTGSEGTFRAYRRELERLLQWTWIVAKKTLTELKRLDIEKYIHFCQAPPKRWIGFKRVAKFINTPDGLRKPNPVWRLFVCSVSKSAFKNGERAEKANYQLSQKAVREIFTILSSFYTHLNNEGIMDINPVLLIRQKSKYFTKQQTSPVIPKLSEHVWKSCVNTAKEMAKLNPSKHERTLFIISALYLLYLRISELAASPRWEPLMNHFFKDANDYWWFITLGKGNKQRTITVSDEMLKALQRYRKSLTLTPLPSPNEQTPLIPKIKGKGGMSSIRVIRKIVQECFDKTVLSLRNNNFKEDADMLENATVHWLRHTGISDDININQRPPSHVRDDAGHSSIAITDRYNDITLQERYLSGKNKKMNPKKH